MGLMCDSVETRQKRFRTGGDGRRDVRWRLLDAPQVNELGHQANDHTLGGLADLLVHLFLQSEKRKGSHTAKKESERPDFGDAVLRER